MAGDWLKIEHDTPDKPEIFSIASVLNIGLGDAFLGCFKAWRWADVHPRDCNAPALQPALLDSYIGATGFARAMANVGWLTITPEGVSFQRLDRHISETANARALTAKRVRRHRYNHNPEGNGQALQTPLPREE
jgi:hypothetical protein